MLIEKRKKSDISINAEKTLDKTQHWFIIKMINKLGVEGDFIHLIKSNYKNPTANNRFNSEMINEFILISGKREGWLILSL